MEMKGAIAQLTALAQESRLEVFRTLVRVGEEGMCAGDLSRELGVTKPTLSFHLKELVNADLLHSEKRGRSITYSLKAESVRILFDFLLQDCCQGKPELCSPAADNNCCN